MTLSQIQSLGSSANPRIIWASDAKAFYSIAAGAAGSAAVNMASLPKIYVARIERDGAVTPTVTVLQNTIGNIVWTHGDVGEDWGTLANAFPVGKTFMTLSGTSGNEITLGPTGQPTAYFTVAAAGAPEHVELITNTPGEGEVDDISFDVIIEIRVYP